MNTIIKRAKKHNRCPICKNEVYTIMQGEPFGSRWVTLKKKLKRISLKLKYWVAAMETKEIKLIIAKIVRNTLIKI